MSEIGKVAVIGAGTMGAQIASLTALSGRTVTLWDASDQALAAGLSRAEQDIFPNLGIARGIHAADLGSALGRLSAAGSLAEAIDGADLVIEAVREELGVKQAVFSELSRMTPAILSTNSSSIPSSLIAPAVERPERLLNTHFFAPIWVRSMLELMTCGETSDEVMRTAYDFGVSLGLVTAIVNGESKGFIINRIWRAVKRESLRVVDEGVATPEDVDRLWMMFFQTQYAPFGIAHQLAAVYPDCIRRGRRGSRHLVGKPPCIGGDEHHQRDGDEGKTSCMASGRATRLRGPTD